jgi:cytoskeleton protein RodZ
LNSVNPQKDTNYTNVQTDLPVGEILRRARMQAGLSLEDVKEQLKMKISQVQALEDMNFEAFSGWIYVTGYIRSYADFLGLDSDKVLLLLKNQTGRHQEKREYNLPEPSSETQMPDLWIIISAVAALVVILIAVIMVQAMSGGDSDVTGIPEIESPPPAVATLETGEKPAAQQPQAEDAEIGYSPEAQQEMGRIVGEIGQVEESAAEATTPAPAANTDSTIPAAEEDVSHRIVINVNEKSWVEIRDETGKKIVSRVLNEGDSFFVPDDANRMTMTTGNASGIELVVDGKELGAVGKRGEIRRNIPLEPESLKEMFAR